MYLDTRWHSSSQSISPSLWRDCLIYVFIWIHSFVKLLLLQKFISLLFNDVIRTSKYKEMSFKKFCSVIVKMSLPECLGEIVVVWRLGSVGMPSCYVVELTHVWKNKKNKHFIEGVNFMFDMLPEIQKTARLKEGITSKNSPWEYILCLLLNWFISFKHNTNKKFSILLKHYAYRVYRLTLQRHHQPKWHRGAWFVYFPSPFFLFNLLYF